MTYNIIYELHVGPERYLLPILTIIGTFVASVAAWTGATSSARQATRCRKFQTYFFVGIFAAVGVWYIFQLYSSGASLARRLTSGDVMTVSGSVTQASIIRVGRGEKESFVVAGLKFETGSMPGCYSSHAAMHSIVDGLNVRISHLDGCILRIEVANGSSRPTGAKR